MRFLKSAPVVSIQPSVAQSLSGFSVSEVADHPLSFGLRMRVNRFAEILETDEIEQIWITFISSHRWRLHYVWADFPLSGWNSTDQTFLGSRAIPEGVWFAVEKDLRRDWLRAGNPEDDTLIAVLISANEPGSVGRGSIPLGSTRSTCT